MGTVVFGGYFLFVRWRASASTENPGERYGITELLPSYPGWTAGEVGALLEETYGRPLVYEAFTHFRELPSPGR